MVRTEAKHRCLLDNTRFPEACNDLLRKEVCMLIKSQTKAFHKVLHADILCTPVVLNFGHVYIATVSVLVLSSVRLFPTLRVLRIGSTWLRPKELQDTMHLSGYTTMEKGPFCQH